MARVPVLHAFISVGLASRLPGIVDSAGLGEVEKALGVHCLAMRAGVPWRKDPPVPAQRLAIVDTDGDQPLGDPSTPYCSRWAVGWSFHGHP